MSFWGHFVVDYLAADATASTWRSIRLKQFELVDWFLLYLKKELYLFLDVLADAPLF